MATYCGTAMLLPDRMSANSPSDSFLAKAIISPIDSGDFPRGWLAGCAIDASPAC